MDPGPSTHNNEPSDSGNQWQRNSIYALQVRAFLEAAEDVGLDAETLDDILDGFEDPDEEQEFPGHARTDAESNGHGVCDESRMFESTVEPEEDDVWSPQEVKDMKRHLKERGSTSFLKEYVLDRAIPIPRLLYAFGIHLCGELRAKRPSTLLYFLNVILSRELRLRERLTRYNTVDDAINLIRKSQRIMILTGAGISVSCGIPDFRSRDGLYATLKQSGEYDLDEPTQMFDIHYFRENPSVFYSFASQIYPSNFTPSLCHRFIKLIEDKNKLLRNYTQNIDTLETLAGVRNVLQCHGSFATASCLHCHQRVPGTDIEDDILQHRVPLCKKCNAAAAKPKKKKKRKPTASGWRSDESDESDGPAFPPGIMKPDITFFHEKLTDDFDHSLLEDRDKVDLLIIMGTSLQVSPVSEIISYLPHSVPQILINKTPIRHINPDIILLGNADDTVKHLCSKLGWSLPPLPQSSSRHLAPPPPPPNNLKKRPSPGPEKLNEPQRVGNSHVWLFNGAEGGEWLKKFEEEMEDTRSNGSSLSPLPSDDEADIRETKKIRIG
ncbi:hypothetical protein JAAARDRAFT_41808 [Jaapia argillacea MUCL 33604]|uniref:Deacetylase sirtuin-type domain-containing protein n=1 Tax=Jaapia argillacea MUCL 33604 TaxID=933084 RepID=A0A067P7E8_9AGAM|nr:hypothetical protein JAAARDRAFT_41808 [Jaapia argillacea MUCL 33604]